jgi:hypothetical protein
MAGMAEGVAIGLAVGAAYAGLLRAGMARVLRLPPERALATVQVGSFLRLATAAAVFFVAGRAFPHANLTAAAASAVAVVGMSLYRLAREGVRA